MASAQTSDNLYFEAVYHYFRPMYLTSSKLKVVLTHVAIWIGYATYEQAIILIVNSSTLDIPFIAFNYLLNAGLFYANSNSLLPYLYARRRYVFYAVAALLLLSGYSLLRCELNLHSLPFFGLAKQVTAGSYGQFWMASLFRGTFFQLVSTGYWFARNAVQLEVQKREHEHQLRLTERSLLEANIALLKSQINPHFLFNTLNFLYAQVYSFSENAAKGILLLSDTMRYTLHEDSNGKVMLDQEITHLHNYIALHQLRFNNRLQVAFELTGNPQFLMILPLLLITFVENSFKHGDLMDANNPLTISLLLEQNHLTFRTHNKKRSGPKEKSTGIGLANTRQRLDLVYKSRYELLIEDSPDYYICTLTLSL
jgi:sensor histidine kinase YesM